MVSHPQWSLCWASGQWNEAAGLKFPVQYWSLLQERSGMVDPLFPHFQDFPDRRVMQIMSIMQV